MEMRIIREIWQAMSLLSDAQECQAALDPDAFLEAVRVVECTLEG